MTEFAFGLRCIPHFSLRMISGEHLDVAGFDFLQSVRLAYVKFGDGGAAQGFEMSSAAETLAHFVSDGAHISSRRHAGVKMGAVSLDGGDGEFLDFDLNRFEDYRFFFAREFVGGYSMNFLRREWRRNLLDVAEEFGGELLKTVQARSGGGNLAQSFAVGVISIRGEAEADDAFVGFFGGDVELR